MSSARGCARWGILVAALSGPVPVQAQETGSCRIELVSVGGTGRRVELGPGRVHQFASGGVSARCIGQPTTMRADSVAWYSELARLDFVGRVRFRDSTATLDASRASYFTADERLEAFGQVRLVNRETGSVLTGPHLSYRRAVPGVRDTTELYATERPTVHYRSAADTAAPPYVIVGNRVRLRGAMRAWAGGAVTVTREDFRAKADSAALDNERGTGVLVGQAEAAGRDSAGYTIRGRRIAFRLTDHKLSWVQAQQDAWATSADWRVAGDTVEFQVANDLVQGGGAWSDTARARATSARHTITADSLAIDSPDQVLTEVRGFGIARALSRVEPPNTSQDSAAPAQDWMMGDTLIARFGDTSAGGRALVLLQAWGDARAFYHIVGGTAAPGVPAINYSRGTRITARFRDEVLETVDVVGAADGVYLEPPNRRPP